MFTDSMTTPHTHNRNSAQVLSAVIPLTGGKRCVNWSSRRRKTETRNEPPWTKPPFRPRDPTRARSNDRGRGIWKHPLQDAGIRMIAPRQRLAVVS
jgi:hypothetical protein